MKQIALGLWVEASCAIEPRSPEASSQRNDEITPLVASIATRESPPGKNLSTFVAPWTLSVPPVSKEASLWLKRQELTWWDL